MGESGREREVCVCGGGERDGYFFHSLERNSSWAKQRFFFETRRTESRRCPVRTRERALAAERKKGAGGLAASPPVFRPLLPHVTPFRDLCPSSHAVNHKKQQHQSRAFR